jgi:thiamine biosynthesis lipoprotein
MQLYTTSFHAMGCPCELRLYAVSAAVAQHATAACISEASRFEQKYSRYLDSSVTSAINRSAGVSATPIDPETAGLLQYAGVCYEQSEGLFDITSGVLRQVWNKDRQALPGQAELGEITRLVGWDKIRLTASEVFLPERGMEIDFGGVVKEYAADAIALRLKSSGISSALVSLGGDIVTFGAQQSGAAWPIGIVHPTQKASAIATIYLKDMALATSGGYERYFELQGRRFSHLINPHTGWPVDSLLSVSVSAEQAIVAGSISSIALLYDRQEAIAWLDNSGCVYLAVDQDLSCYGSLAS